VSIPEKARRLIEKGKVIPLATCSEAAVPNVVYMLKYWWHGADTLVIGDLFMQATRRNILENGRASFCVWDEDTDESYKFVGTATYETSGAAYDMANGRLHETKPDKNFKGVVVIRVAEVYEASRTPNAGALIATV
jgi:predicted pyridoxine 5'-phosphate oxidase superfamily flavin-nucleotide-binding protein